MHRSLSSLLVLNRVRRSEIVFLRDAKKTLDSLIRRRNSRNFTDNRSYSKKRRAMRGPNDENIIFIVVIQTDVEVILKLTSSLTFEVGFCLP